MAAEAGYVGLFELMMNKSEELIGNSDHDDGPQQLALKHRVVRVAIEGNHGGMYNYLLH